jgi:hypothetical protein
MKPICFAAALMFVVAGCTSTSPPVNSATGADTLSGNPDSYILHVPNGQSAARPPRLTVGTSYPDTQLILPWFLNDLIDFVNYR